MTRKRDRLIDKKIGSVIRMQRVKLRMSQSDLGNSLGVTFQQIQKYENGGNAVASTRIQICAGHWKSHRMTCLV
jgi:DNA-binding XRE family transcriptional regulator